MTKETPPDLGVEPSCPLPPHLTSVERETLAQIIKDWASGHGLVVKPSPAVIAAEADPNSIAAVPAPVTLFPSGIARNAFREGLAAQRAYNELYAAVSRDEQFLADIVKQVIDGDDFVRDLWAVHQTVKSEGYTQVRGIEVAYNQGDRFEMGSDLQVAAVTRSIQV
ncbi:hypothetical protein E4U53_001190 [Claviceps sorghi]|nr:hypothetical protein E4U53_001190 [Claviceps sorghi]